MSTNTKNIIFSIGIAYLPAIIGGFFMTAEATHWYTMINRPAFTPPDWLFGPVWFVLYGLMAIALYDILQIRWFKKKKALFARKVFYVHLFVNGLWSILFFGLQQPLWALVDIVILYGMIIWLISLFWTLDKRASYVLMPYAAWVSYALVLNAGIALLN